MTTRFSQLNIDKTLKTMEILQNRISERFENSSLSQVAAELCEIARESKEKIRWIDRPHRGLRAAIAGVVVLSLIVVAYGANQLVTRADENLGLTDALGLLDSLTSEVVFAGAALIFLFSLEVRFKRTRALKMIHDLRALAHVVDMHQLTKDPSRILYTGVQTKSSPERQLTPFQLTRYLDYCSELLSMLGKLAALYAQSLPDPVVVGAVNDIESLTNGLSRKIWQKIVMLDDVARIVKTETDGQAGDSSSAS